MNKDLFCKLWLENRDNQIISELMMSIEDLENIISESKAEKKCLTEELDDCRNRSVKELRNIRQHLNDLGRKIVENLGDDKKIYDVLEEEFTLDFIIKVKLENNLDLEKHEREHLISKL